MRYACLFAAIGCMSLLGDSLPAQAPTGRVRDLLQEIELAENRVLQQKGLERIADARVQLAEAHVRKAGDLVVAFEKMDEVAEQQLQTDAKLFAQKIIAERELNQTKLARVKSSQELAEARANVAAFEAERRVKEAESRLAKIQVDEAILKLGHLKQKLEAAK